MLLAYLVTYALKRETVNQRVEKFDGTESVQQLLGRLEKASVNFRASAIELWGPQCQEECQTWALLWERVPRCLLAEIQCLSSVQSQQVRSNAAQDLGLVQQPGKHRGESESSPRIVTKSPIYLALLAITNLEHPW